MGVLKYHTKPITSVEWNLNDSTVFAASSEDNQLTIWDLAVEKDDEEQMEDDGGINFYLIKFKALSYNFFL